MKIEIDYNHYMAMLKQFTKIPQSKQEGIRCKAENKILSQKYQKLKLVASNKVK